MITRNLLVTASALVLASTATLLGENDGVVAVFSAVSPAYTRTALSGGSFQSETYAFGEGGDWGGSSNDSTIDKLKFVDVAHMIAPALATKKYLPSKDPQQTGLLIMVYWGTTNGTSDARSAPEYQFAELLKGLSQPMLGPAQGPNTGLGGVGTSAGGTSDQQQRAVLEEGRNMELDRADMMITIANRNRDRQNYQNAMLLGYLPELHRMNGYEWTPLRQIRRDLVQDLEENRYFVVLMAYDFQSLWKHKERKLLWETRFSIRERRNDFSKALAAMAENASRYFGQDSHGLIRERLPETYITFGEPKVLGYEAATKK
jgi:hypothetical protein